MMLRPDIKQRVGGSKRERNHPHKGCCGRNEIKKSRVSFTLFSIVYLYVFFSSTLPRVSQCNCQRVLTWLIGLCVNFSKDLLPVATKTQVSGVLCNISQKILHFFFHAYAAFIPDISGEGEFPRKIFP